MMQGLGGPVTRVQRSQCRGARGSAEGPGEGGAGWDAPDPGCLLGVPAEVLRGQQGARGTREPEKSPVEVRGLAVRGQA